MVHPDLSAVARTADQMLELLDRQYRALKTDDIDTTEAATDQIGTVGETLALIVTPEITDALRTPADDEAAAVRAKLDSIRDRMVEVADLAAASAEAAGDCAAFLEHAMPMLLGKERGGRLSVRL